MLTESAGVERRSLLSLMRIVLPAKGHRQVKLFEHAQRLGLGSFLPQRYTTAEAATYPCSLTTADGRSSQLFWYDSSKPVRLSGWSGES